MASTNFINECKNGANHNRLGKILVDDIKTESGTSLTLTDAENAPISNTKLYGYIKQNTYSGKNLLNITATSITVSGLTITVNENKSITLNGEFTGQSTYWFRLAPNFNIPAGTYTISNGNPDVSQETGIFVDDGNHFSRVNEQTKTFEEEITFKPYIRIAAGSSFDNFTIYPMLVSGSEVGNYEPYTGEQSAPNPDYPMDIEVGKGKSIIDFSTIDYTSANDATVTRNGKEYTITNGESQWGCVRFYQTALNLKPNTTYTFSAKVKFTTSTVGSRAYNDSQMGGTANWGNYAFEDGRTYNTFTTPNTINDGAMLALYPAQSNKEATFTDIMIEENDYGTFYVDYNNIGIRNYNNNLWNVNNQTTQRIIYDKLTDIYSAIDEDTRNPIRLKLQQYDRETYISGSQESTENITKTGKVLFTSTRLDNATRIRFANNGNVREFGVFLPFPEEIKYGDKFTVIVDMIDVTMGASKFKNIQLLKGEYTLETAPEYTQYKESTIQYDLNGNFLADKDYIENGVLHKNIGKVVLDGSETYTKIALTNGYRYYTTNNNINLPQKQSDGTDIMSNYFKGIKYATYYQVGGINGITYSYYQNNSHIQLFFENDMGSASDLQTWLSNNPVTVYYELAEETIERLETTGKLKTYEGTTHIENDLDSNMYIDYRYLKDEINESNYLANFSIDDGCYVDGNIIGSIYIKKAEANFLTNLEDIDFLDKKIQAQIGVKYDDNSTEYINLGNYTIERPNDLQTANKFQITAYDNLINNIESKYVSNIDYEQQNITLKDLYIDVCNQLLLTPSTTEFLNNNIPIQSNPFTNNETNRVVLQTIAKIACSFVTINTDTDEIELSWLSESEEPNYTFELSDYSTLEGGKIEYGPINNVVIKNSQVDDENVSQQDDESIAEYGLHTISISEDYILYNAELRQQAITAIFNRLNGLKYVDSKIACYYGKPFIKIGNKIRIYIDDENYFDTYVLKHNFSYDGAFTSIIESPVLTEQEIKTKQDISLGEALRNTEIQVNKQEGKISLINQKTTEIQDSLSNNYYTIEQTNNLVSSAETGLTNTFVQSGGNNMLRNTGLWFEQSDSNNPYEYWSGKASKITNDSASSKTSIILMNDNFEQSQPVANGNFTISFKYKKLISLATATVTINDKVYNLTETETTEFYTGKKNEDGEYIIDPLEISSNQIDIKFTCNIDNAVEIYDLMCNQGTEKTVWSQNQNETTTETVNISQGITIISNTTNTKFKADSDGVRIFDKNDTTNSNPITEFTDKGMTTKEATIENQSIIVGILRQQVGDQIWDCLII